MAPTDKEERRRMRQRGAGTQVQAKTFNFGATLQDPPALAPKRSSRKTPPIIQPRNSSRRTPVRSSASKVAGSLRRSRSASANASNSVQSGKLRPVKTPRAGATPKFVTPSTTGKRKRGQNDAEASHGSEQDDLERNDQEFMASAQKSQASKQRASLTISPQERDQAPDELEANDENHMISSGRPRRDAYSVPKSIEATPVPSRASEEQGSTGRSKRREPLAAIGEETPASTQVTTVNISKAEKAPTIVETPVSRPTARKRIIKSTKTVKQQAPHVVHEDEQDDVDELSPENTTKLTQTQVEEVIDEELDELSPDLDRSRKVRKPNTAKAQEHQDEALDELSPDLGRSRNIVRPSAAKASERVDFSEESLAAEEEDEEAERSEVSQQRQPPKPAPKKRPAPIRAESVSFKPKKKRQRTSETEVPITVYRLFHPKRSTQDLDLGTIRYRVGGITGVDVLAQMAKETLENFIRDCFAKVSKAKTQEQRSQWKRRLGVMQVFNNEIGDRLADMQVAVDAGKVLKHSLRAAENLKLKLFSEYTEIQRQREEVALKKDAVREEYDELVRIWQKQEDLNSAMFDIEAAIHKGRIKAMEEGIEDEGPDVPLEMLLDTVAHEVSSDGGGLLKDLQSFNSVLEKAADFLEGRAV